MALRSYLIGEVAEEFADGQLTRREALRRLGLLGVALPGATALLTACGGGHNAGTGAAAGPVAPQSTPPPGADVGQLITFAAGSQAYRAAFAKAEQPKGAVLIVHENKGLTTHFFELTGRLAGNGYTAICVDLLSRANPQGLAGYTDQAAATAALAGIPMDELLADLSAGVDELLRRAGAAQRVGVLGFCFGGGMTWNLLQAGPRQEKRIAAAVPFYGPAPQSPDFTGAKAAVLANYAGNDDRVTSTRPQVEAALRAAGLTYEIQVWPGVDHAFFNNTGPSYNAPAATAAQAKFLAWFDRHLAG